VKKSVLEVVETIGISLVLVILIIFLFFRDLAIAFRPLIDIPVSLIATFFIMYLFGFSQCIDFARHCIGHRIGGG
jgi:HAE1 family hydrophobic/amphiphilic exporter-1/multidrug efflux pump